MNVEGVTLTQLWYTNTDVTFTGIALENATVTATINGTTGSTTADASGNWSYTTTLNEADNSVSFESGGSTISFTLTIGTLPEGVGGLTTAETPTVGITTPTFILIFLGTLFLSSAFFLLRKNFLKA
jgi:VCBS repeat-containing protein